MHNKIEYFYSKKIICKCRNIKILQDVFAAVERKQSAQKQYVQYNPEYLYVSAQP